MRKWERLTDPIDPEAFDGVLIMAAVAKQADMDGVLPSEVLRRSYAKQGITPENDEKLPLLMTLFDIIITGSSDVESTPYTEANIRNVLQASSEILLQQIDTLRSG